jgi:cytochrome c5
MASLFFGLIAACYPKAGAVPAPAATADLATASARWPNASAEGLAAGRATFIEKCNGCHDYPDVTSIDEAKWPGILARMGKKADLDSAATENVLHFVLVARSRK